MENELSQNNIFLFYFLSCPRHYNCYISSSISIDLYITAYITFFIPLFGVFNNINLSLLLMLQCVYSISLCPICCPHVCLLYLTVPGPTENSPRRCRQGLMPPMRASCSGTTHTKSENTMEFKSKGLNLSGITGFHGPRSILTT
jgi:hypothetical protein